MRLVSGLRALFVCAVFTAIGIAQTDVGSLGGFVRDPSGGVIPKSKVVIKNEATGEERLTRHKRYWLLHGHKPAPPAYIRSG